MQQATYPRPLMNLRVCLVPILERLLKLFLDDASQTGPEEAAPRSAIFCALCSSRRLKEPKKSASPGLLLLCACGPRQNCPFSVHISSNKADDAGGRGVGGLKPAASPSGLGRSNAVERRGGSAGPVALEEASSRLALGQRERRFSVGGGKRAMLIPVLF
jgi:hypothetical protein